MSGLQQIVFYGGQDVYISGSAQVTFWHVVRERHARKEIRLEWYSARRRWYNDYLISGDLSGPISAVRSGLFTGYIAGRQFQNHLLDLAHLRVQITLGPNKITRCMPIELAAVIWSHMRWRLPPMYICTRALRVITISLKAALERARRRIKSHRRLRSVSVRFFAWICDNKPWCI
jgi:hypothetical protein